MKRIMLLALLATFALAVPAGAQGGDADGDGVPDGSDRCPAAAGPPMFYGCPTDQDNDGVGDEADSCWGAPGTAEHQGCPFDAGDTDADGDGMADRFDACPSQPSREPLGRGCPPPDGDGDGFVGAADRCPSVAGPDNGCPRPPAGVTPTPVTPTPVHKQTATSVRAGGIGVERAKPKRLKALAIDGVAFLANPDTAYMTPKRLTIWLPKGMTVSSAPAAPCTEAFAKAMTLDTDKRCAFMIGGRVSDEGLRGWQAYAGPKEGKRQRLWLRGVGQETDEL